MQIQLNHGKVAIIDDDDYELIKQYKWGAHEVGTHIKTWYATANPRINGKYKTVRMHQILMQPAYGQVVDHINRNGLDNRRSNLRFS